MHARENIQNGFWFSLGFGIAIVALTMGCFRFTEAGLSLLKGDPQMDEDEKMTEHCKEFEPQLKPENNIRPEGPNTLPSDEPEEEKRRSDIQLAVAATVIDKTIITCIPVKEAPGSVTPELFIQLPAIRDFLKELKALRVKLQRPCVGSADFKEDCFVLRAQIKETKIQTMLVFNEHPALSEDVETVGYSVPVTADVGEMKANLKLAFRHLEDARMRLGKAIQAFDGGESCYQR